MIKISSTKLKIMLSAEDMKLLDFDPVGREDISCRAGFRSILREAKARCGFDAVGERVFVQYYPEKHGGCEMFVTKLAEDRRAHDRQAQKICRTAPRTKDVAGEYIVYAYQNLDGLLATCKRLSASGYRGKSAAYSAKSAVGQYFLVLDTEIIYAGEYGAERVNYKFTAFLSEHGKMFSNDAVKTLSGLA